MFIKKIYKSIIKLYLAIILFIIISFLYSNNYINDDIFKSNIDFRYIKSKTKYLLGKFHGETHYVSSEKLMPKSISMKNNANVIELDEKYVIKNLEGGVVSAITDYEDLGKTVIISSDDSIDYYYSNLENISVKLYDYISKDIVIGNVIDNYLILTIKKDNEYLKYEDLY